MSTYTVVEYKREKGWEGKFGPMKDHIIDVRDEMGHTKEVMLGQKASTPTPKVGDKLTLTLEQTQWGTKARRVQQQGAGSSTGGGTWKPRDPSETAAIQRQHSQETAIRFIAINAAASKAMAGLGAKEALDKIVKPITDWFQRDIEAGKLLAAQDAKTREGYGQQRKDPVRTGESDVTLADAVKDFPVGSNIDVDDVPF